jgi:hypothetical protein
MTLFSLLISCINCEFVFAVYCMLHPSPNNSSRFLASYMTLILLSNPCVGHDSIFAIHFMRGKGIIWRHRFHTAAVTQFPLMISRSTGTLFSLMIYGSAVTKHFCQFHASTMTLFLLMIWCVGHEFSDAVYSIRQLSLSFQWRFLGLESLSFC